MDSAWIKLGLVAMCLCPCMAEPGLLVAYWGQNSVSNKPPRDRYEEPLEHFCIRGRYDIVVLAFLHVFFTSASHGFDPGLPKLNFANHCYSSVPGTAGLLRCSNIENAVKICQEAGTRVLISLGGAVGPYGFTNDLDSTPVTFANRIWNLFLNGNEYPHLRPFGSVILDGIDLDIENNDHRGYSLFVTKLREHMDSDQSKPYLITAAPQCVFPDRSLGPDSHGVTGTALQTVPHLFDYLFVQYYNNVCYPGSTTFRHNFELWSNVANYAATLSTNGRSLKILVGLPAGEKASGNKKYFRSIENIESICQDLSSDPNFGGIMLWDAGWEESQLSADGTQTYGESIRNVLLAEAVSEHIIDPGTTTTTEAPPTTETSPETPPQTTTETPPETTTEATTASPTTTVEPGGSTTPEEICEEHRNGLHSHPDDCSKFVQCSHGASYMLSCPPGLRFNSAGSYCDWSYNVVCP